MKLVITIGRQFGSGGREVGVKLARRLGIGFYDRELIAEASRISGLSSEMIEQNDEKHPGSFAHALSLGLHPGQGFTPENIFKIQSDAILEIARGESCVIVGRSADYVLRNHPMRLSVFVHAPREQRIRCVAERLDLSEKKAAELIHKTDKSRASYYNFYTDKDWGACDSYDIALDSSLLGIDLTVEYLYQLSREFQRRRSE